MSSYDGPAATLTTIPWSTSSTSTDEPAGDATVTDAERDVERDAGTTPPGASAGSALADEDGLARGLR